jgi:hypothetical protein
VVEYVFKYCFCFIFFGTPFFNRPKEAVCTIFAGFWENFGLDLGPFDRNVVCNYFAVYCVAQLRDGEL